MVWQVPEDPSSFVQADPWLVVAQPPVSSSVAQASTHTGANTEPTTARTEDLTLVLFFMFYVVSLCFPFFHIKTMAGTIIAASNNQDKIAPRFEKSPNFFP